MLIALGAALAPISPAKAQRTPDWPWHLHFLQITTAHNHSRGEGSIVSVIDTGVAPHPAIQDNLISGIETIEGHQGNGLTDIDGHGTKMAGIIAAHGPSRNDELGIAPEARVLVIRASNTRRDGDPENIARGIEWSIKNGARIINISSSGSSTPLMRDAITKAIQSDVVVVAAVGNRPSDLLIGFPAAHEGVVAVGAVDRQGNRAEVSVTGAQLDIVAPGVDISGPGLNGEYVTGSGTSNSAAIVSGAAALVRSRFPELSAEEVVHRLTYTAVDKGAPGRDDEYGYGVLDLVAALTADVPPLGEGATPATPATTGPADSGHSREDDEGQSGGVRFNFIAVLVVALAGGLFVLGYRRHRRRESI
nr:type VII secretion-associated serine protease mycosin [Micromonospora sp. DSM 115978]